MRDAIATASDDGSRSAWSSDVAMTRTQPSEASTMRWASVDEPGGSTSTISASETDSDSLSMISPSTSWVTSWMASATRRPAISRRAGPSASSMSSSEDVDLLARQQVGVVDEDVGRGETAVGERAELAAQAQHIAIEGAPRQPRLPVSRRRLEEDHRRDIGSREAGEQRSPGEAHMWRCRQPSETVSSDDLDGAHARRR